MYMYVCVCQTTIISHASLVETLDDVSSLNEDLYCTDLALILFSKFPPYWTKAKVSL